jgi:hypothetical protein
MTHAGLAILMLAGVLEQFVTPPPVELSYTAFNRMQQRLMGGQSGGPFGFASPAPSVSAPRT